MVVIVDIFAFCCALSASMLCSPLAPSCLLPAAALRASAAAAGAISQFRRLQRISVCFGRQKDAMRYKDPEIRKSTIPALTASGSSID